MTRKFATTNSKHPHPSVSLKNKSTIPDDKRPSHPHINREQKKTRLATLRLARNYHISSVKRKRERASQCMQKAIFGGIRNATLAAIWRAVQYTSSYRAREKKKYFAWTFGCATDGFSLAAACFFSSTIRGEARANLLLSLVYFSPLWCGARISSFFSRARAHERRDKLFAFFKESLRLSGIGLCFWAKRSFISGEWTSGWWWMDFFSLSAVILNELFNTLKHVWDENVIWIVFCNFSE